MVQLIVGQLLNGIIIGTLYGIIALGVTLTFGITGIVNFALGAFMAIGAYLATKGQITVGTFVTFESAFWEVSYNIAHIMHFIPVSISSAAASTFGSVE